MCGRELDWASERKERRGSRRERVGWRGRKRGLERGKIERERLREKESQREREREISLVPQQRDVKL